MMLAALAVVIGGPALVIAGEKTEAKPACCAAKKAALTCPVTYAPCPMTPEAEKAAGFVTLFDGTSLDGWEVMGENKNGFQLVDGTIHRAEDGGHWIRYTKKKFANFILRLEYKVAKGANSGVFLRCKKEGDPPYTGFEVQVLDDYGHDPDKHTSGAIYDIVTPMYNMSKPVGQWNNFDIYCNGGNVIVYENGRKIIDCNFDELTMPIGKFSIPYAELPKVGWIGLQDHGTPVWFRNIRIKELPAGEK
jgi:hypothetical protein